MVILLDKFDLDILDLPPERNFVLVYYPVTEERVKNLIQFNRCRTIFSKTDITSFFNLSSHQHIVKVDKVSVKPYDKVVVRTKNKDHPFFVFEVVDAVRFCPVFLRAYARTQNKKRD